MCACGALDDWPVGPAGSAAGDRAGVYRSGGGGVMAKIVLGTVVGGAVGFAIGYFGRCAGGACPLTGNPVIATIIGVLCGAFLVAGR